MNKRLKSIRKHFGLNQKEMGEKIKLSQTHISSLENGARELTDRIISDICREFNIDEHWFCTGEGGGEILFVENDSTIITELANEYKLDATDIKIIEHYINLHDEERQKIKDYIISLAAHINGTSKTSIFKETKSEISAATDTTKETLEEKINREAEQFKRERLLEEKIQMSSASPDLKGKRA